MAERVDDFPTLKWGTKYPWNEWLDGNVWALTPGEDFDVAVDAMRSAVNSSARRRGGRAHTSHQRGDDRLYIQFLPEGSE